MHSRFFLLLSITMLGATARAQDLKTEIVNGARLSLSAEPGVWFAAPGGDVRFPRSTPGPSNSILATTMNMDSPRLSPTIEINVSSTERWGGTLRAFTYSATNRGFVSPTSYQLGDNVLSSGATARASLDYTSIELEARYRLQRPWRDLPGERTVRPVDEFDRSLDLVAGLRVIDFSLDVSQVGPGGVTPVASADSTFVMPEVGVKGTLELYEQATIDLQTTFGGMLGNETSFAWDIMVGFQWRPIDNVGFQLGYRQLLYRLSEDDSQLQWDGAVAGFYASLVVRF